MPNIVRMPAVKSKTGYRSHASIYGAIRVGLFTKPVSIGSRSVGWPEHEIDLINTARIAGASDLDIRALVDRLHSQRVAAYESAEVSQ